MTAARGVDLRTCALGTAAWLGALLGLLTDGWVRRTALAVLAIAAVLVLVTGAAGPVAVRRMAAACLSVAAVLIGIAGLHVDALRASPVANLADQHAAVQAALVVRSDPSTTTGRFGDLVIVRCTLTQVVGRGQTWTTRVPVLVLGDESWAGIRLGSHLRATGRLLPAARGDVAGVLSSSSAPTVDGRPATVYRAADGVRSAVRRAASGGPGESSKLVPALVTGDDQGLSDQVSADFKTAGLTHLTAVSGTNLTLVLAALLLTARWAGVRGRAQVGVGLLGVVGFVLLARPEPSVLRAAAMGTVALLGMGSGGRASGVRALGLAALVLLTFDPALAVSPGFALSALATAGILLVAPGFRDALASWLPRWAAEAVAVPTAAQLACTPLIAGISGQVSLVAVAANLVVAPLVAPATVLGLAGGLLGLVWTPAGAALGWLAGGCAAMIIVVAQLSAGLPGAAVTWPAGPLAMLVLSAASLVLLTASAPLLRRRGLVLAVAGVLVLAVLRPLPSPLSLLPGAPRWPPRGWVLVMCDVGQGDALVLATGASQAVVIDAGPDPAGTDHCLQRLGVTEVPVVVLTHFHADHVDGLAGVLRHRAVGEIEVSPLREPGAGAQLVDRVAHDAAVPVRVPAYGEALSLGPVSWQVLSPHHLISDSPNEGSVVMLVHSHGLTLLLTGDVEPPSQGVMLRAGLPPIDVLKVPHHGSEYQDPRLLTGLGARLALVSVGVDNDYGHPADQTLDLLKRAGALVRRTDRDGDVAVVVRAGRLEVVSRG